MCMFYNLILCLDLSKTVRRFDAHCGNHQRFRQRRKFRVVFQGTEDAHATNARTWNPWPMPGQPISYIVYCKQFARQRHTRTALDKLGGNVEGIQVIWACIIVVWFICKLYLISHYADQPTMNLFIKSSNNLCVIWPRPNVNCTGAWPYFPITWKYPYRYE